MISQAAQSRQPCVNSHWLSQWEALGTSHYWLLGSRGWRRIRLPNFVKIGQRY